MSSYALAADLTTHCLSARAVSGVDPVALQTQLDASSDLADTYLTARYPNPLTTWGLALRVKVCEHASLGIMSVVGFTPGATDQIIILRYEAAVRWFENVRDGKITPPSTNTAPDPDPQARVQQYVAPGTNGTPFIVGTTRQRGW